MEFAERHLREQGWSWGKGLGRHEDGMSEALKVKVKCDKTGVGHHAGEQFTFHWWDHVFNKAATNITVETKEDGAEVKEVSKDGGLSVSNKKPRKAQLCKELLYGRFVQAATLMPGSEAVEATPDSSDDSEADDKLDLSSATRLTDEELLRVCGGRTGHKGARHGVTMSAKLLRLEEQERQFLARYRPVCQSGAVSQVAAEAECPPGQVTEGGVTQKKKKRKRERVAPRQEADGSETARGRQRDGESQYAGAEPESGVPITSGRDLAPELGHGGSEGKRKRRKRETAAQSEDCGRKRKRSKGERCPLG
ncbi:G patch domain-containing protein 4 [Mustelus asterias]